MPDKSVNAFALPGGYIVLNTGLLMAAKSPEELAGVIAHEAAHIALQHGLKQMISSAGTYALFQSLFGDASGLIAVIADNSAFLLTRKYSRDYEREADDRAWDYLLAANIDPRGMTDFFHTLLAAQEKNNLNPLENALNFLSTHPTSRERIEHLQEKFKRLDDRAGYVSFPLDFKVFQDAIRNLASQEAAEP
jgi:predicted Zn-dependent protease